MNNPNDVLYLLAVHRCLNVTKIRHDKLKGGFENWEKVYNAPNKDLMAAGLTAKAIARFDDKRKRLNIKTMLENLEKCGAQVLVLGDEDYPDPLAQLYSPPVVLFVRGNWSTDLLPSVSIVGSRRMSQYGKRVIKEFVEPLAQKGVTITSGLAMGVDAQAHLTALGGAGKTIGVLGSGIDQFTPATTSGIANRIIKEDKGVVISEYFPGVAARAEHFPHRNRIVAGLSKVIVAIEAAENSGSLITARLGVDQGKEVFAVPGDVFHAGAFGTNQLIQKGMAEPLIHQEQLAQSLGIDKMKTQRMIQQKLPLGEEENTILQSFGAENEQHIDQIIEKTKLPSSMVSSYIGILELKGYLEHLGAQRYLKTI